MDRTIFSICLLFLTAVFVIEANDAGRLIYINSVDIESIANIPLTGITEEVKYSLGGMTQLNIKFGHLKELSLLLRAGASIYDNPLSKDLGYYNFTAMVGIGYNYAIGDTPMVLTPSLYGGVIGHLSKSSADSLENILKNVYANQIIGADLELSYMPWIIDRDEFFGFYSAGSIKAVPDSGDLAVHLEIRAGLRLFFN